MKIVLTFLNVALIIENKLQPSPGTYKRFLILSQLLVIKAWSKMSPMPSTQHVLFDIPSTYHWPMGIGLNKTTQLRLYVMWIDDPLSTNQRLLPHTKTLLTSHERFGAKMTIHIWMYNMRIKNVIHHKSLQIIIKLKRSLA